ncbi:protein of unknown function [Mesotoga infera]|uniref:Uncharacterized protein n=1 Tax=Mesotoga infera TaxID=1236046 RepID=A0A7Z7LDV7_9BACT|nr:protein of unknown function [Mesotoga infera]
MGSVKHTNLNIRAPGLCPRVVTIMGGLTTGINRPEARITEQRSTSTAEKTTFLIKNLPF